MFINPEIVEISDEAQTGDEGCLSFPDIFVPVKRGMRAKVRARDLDGKVFEVEGEGLFARALQHETDHLNGRLLIDQVGPVKRELIKRKLRKDAEAERRKSGRERAAAGRHARRASGGSDGRLMLTIALSASSSTAATARPPSSAARRASSRSTSSWTSTSASAERAIVLADTVDYSRVAEVDRRRRDGRAAPSARVAGAPDGWRRPRAVSARAPHCGSSCAS